MPLELADAEAKEQIPTDLFLTTLFGYRQMIAGISDLRQ